MDKPRLRSVGEHDRETPKPRRKLKKTFRPAVAGQMDNYAKAHWRWLLPRLEERGLDVRQEDGDMLGVYVDQCRIYWACTQRIKDEGLFDAEGNPHVAVGMKQDAYRIMAELAERFGLDPLSRMVDLEGKHSEDENDDDGYGYY